MSLDPDHLTRQAKAKIAAMRAGNEFHRQCARVKTDPHNVEQALADIAECEAVPNG
jgi:hypothetical protein